MNYPISPEETKEIINWESARLKIDAYGNDPRRIIHQNGDDTSPIVESFFFPTYQLLQIALRSDKALYFGFGFHADSDRPTGYTLIAFAIDSKGKALHGENDVIYDSGSPEISDQNGNISGGEAIRAMKEYIYKQAIPIETGNSFGLNGFVVPKDEIRYLINRNSTEIEFIMAYHAERDILVDNLGYTLIFVGVQKDVHGNRVRMTEELGDIFDYCHPCPTKCPANIKDFM